jgi:ABC-2 type transport system ATP-binding protein
VITVKNLTKFFGAKKAVDDVSFRVEKGEILGFLGPNGAGKSTTMRMITGFIPPSSGTAEIGGHDVLADPISARKKLGYLPENAPVYPDMTVFSYLNFCAEIRGFKGKDRKKRVEDTIQKCFLSGVEHQAVSTLSKGYKQRVCFAQSIIHDPEYLIMDEPTDGLDPNQKHEVRLMIREMSVDKAIILSTHILDEVDAICTRAVIIANGRIVADDTPAGLRKQSSLHGALSVTIRHADAEQFLTVVKNVSGVRDARILENSPNDIKARIFPESPDAVIVDQVMSELSVKGYEIKSLFVEQGRLDEVFRNITTG